MTTLKFVYAEDAKKDEDKWPPIDVGMQLFVISVNRSTGEVVMYLGTREEWVANKGKTNH
jgi:hypothetical protein